MINIYDLPELYSIFFEHDLTTMQWVNENLHCYFPNGVDFFLEPACGTGYWFDKIKANNYLGIDNNPIILNWVRNNKQKSNVHLTLGDMLFLEQFTKLKFNLILLLGNTTGHLNTIDELLLHLKSVRRVISEKGYYFVGIPLKNDFFQEEINLIREKTKFINIRSGGKGCMETRNSFINGSNDIIRYSYEIKIKNNPNYKPIIKFHIDLKSFDSKEIFQIIKIAKFEICKINYLQIPSHPSSENLYNLGLAYLVLRPKIK